MNGIMLNEVDKQLKDHMKGTMEQLKKMQGSKLGTIPKSTKEKNKLKKRIESLPEDEQNRTMQELASAAGHQGKEFDDCEMCKFMREG